MSKQGMYEVDPIRAIFTTISMGFAEAVKQGTITQEQEDIMLARLNELVTGVLSGEVIVWSDGKLSLMSVEDAQQVVKERGIEVFDHNGNPTELGSHSSPSSGKKLVIGGKK